MGLFSSAVLERCDGALDLLDLRAQALHLSRFVGLLLRPGELPPEDVELFSQDLDLLFDFFIHSSTVLQVRGLFSRCPSAKVFRTKRDPKLSFHNQLSGRNDIR